MGKGEGKAMGKGKDPRARVRTLPYATHTLTHTRTHYPTDPPPLPPSPCTVLYCTVLYCTILYYTVLYSNLAKEKSRLSSLQSTLDALEAQKGTLQESVKKASATFESIAKSSPISTDLEGLVLTDSEMDLSSTKQQIATIR